MSRFDKKLVPFVLAAVMAACVSCGSVEDSGSQKENNSSISDTVSTTESSVVTTSSTTSTAEQTTTESSSSTAETTTTTKETTKTDKTEEETTKAAETEQVTETWEETEDIPPETYTEPPQTTTKAQTTTTHKKTTTQQTTTTTKKINSEKPSCFALYFAGVGEEVVVYDGNYSDYYITGYDIVNKSNDANISVSYGKNEAYVQCATETSFDLKLYWYNDETGESYTSSTYIEYF